MSCPGHVMVSEVKGNKSVYQEWLQLRYDYLTLTPEVKNLIHSLRQHYFVALITNGPSCGQWEKVERLKLKPFFDTILVSGDLPYEKPHYKIFHDACDHLGIAPHQCIMVGDKLKTDILGGIQAGLGGTVWTPLNDNRILLETDPKPDFIIENVTDLPKLLTKVKRVSNFRNNIVRRLNGITLSDIDDCSSNSSDGS
ncbi:hypothetical protein NQ315_009160 [Exocentrus adspersus]|uniref:N-acylneuraminate-9-phosphatase n=1 Tax=Exocentrus adspersus TaxID=1586481 RepID=A0AAV8WF05_9CUCU|nr:hypothetical protein NQ315_009160 [Exocentrus adspersus]